MRIGRRAFRVMPGLDPGIPTQVAGLEEKHRDCRDLGERSDAVLRTALLGNDD
jgi:hypothetical protein